MTSTASLYARECINFINESPSPFHAVKSCVTKLEGAGFRRISERDTWQLAQGGKYFFTRNQSTIVAFAVGGKYKAGNGAAVIAAHTDSPHPKVKPVSDVRSNGFVQVGVELYGGGQWHTWFDRDLAVAGRVMVKGKDGETTSTLVNIDRPIMRIPTLAIHLTKGAEREAFAPNREEKVLPVLASAIKANLTEGSPKHSPLLVSMLADALKCQESAIGDFELSIYDHHKATIGGAKNEFLFAPRLDNLCSSYCALEALIAGVGENDTDLAGEEGVRAICLFDHEECGSNSAQGAASSLLERFILRLTAAFTTATDNATEVEEHVFRNSMVVSADMAHGLHPNYPEKHERNHKPTMHGGIVFKYNANQRYATNAPTVSLLRNIASSCDVPIQDFVVRNDSPCGSTVGPILASNTGIRTIDIGAPQLSMHSIREMCATDDVDHYYRLMKAFLSRFVREDRKMCVD